MVDVNPINTSADVFNLYNKQKSQLKFQEKTDNDFITFLLDTADRVITLGMCYNRSLHIKTENVISIFEK